MLTLQTYISLLAVHYGMPPRLHHVTAQKHQETSLEDVLHLGRVVKLVNILLRTLARLAFGTDPRFEGGK